MIFIMPAWVTHPWGGEGPIAMVPPAHPCCLCVAWGALRIHVSCWGELTKWTHRVRLLYLYWVMSNMFTAYHEARWVNYA